MSILVHNDTSNTYQRKEPTIWITTDNGTSLKFNKRSQRSDDPPKKKG